MKATSIPLVLLLLLLLLLLFAFFSTSPSLVTGDASPEPVLDTTGKNLRAGVTYRIVRPNGALGLALGGTRNRTCPLDVVEASGALPLTFKPTDPKKSTIRVSSDLNIRFSASTVCVESTVWRLGRFDGPTGQRFVTTGGAEGGPGRGTVSNWFEIEKFGNGTSESGDYKLVFCPKVCKFCKVLCKDLGIYVDDDDGKRRVVLNDVAYRVRFQKA